jgi:hypothetical protein
VRFLLRLVEDLLFGFLDLYFENCGDCGILWIFGIMWVCGGLGDFMRTENGIIPDFWNNVGLWRLVEILFLFFEFFEN